MKKIYRQALQVEFEKEMKEQLNLFSQFKLKLTKEQKSETVIFAGSEIYAYQFHEHLTFFLHMIPRQTQEGFLLEFGWSVNGVFPHKLTRQIGPKLTGEEMASNDMLLDYGVLHHKKYNQGFLDWKVWEPSVPRGHPQWREIFIKEDLLPVSEEQAQERVKKPVAQCIKAIKDDVIPYFNEYLKFHKLPEMASVEG